jgi:hypothetical protein
MNEITFKTDIYYSQLSVFQNGLENPFNDWNDTHINQGFSWRDGSVSFGTLSDDEECEITVRVTESLAIDTDDVIRAILVPFYIGNNGIEVGSVMETIVIDIEEGNYGLLFTVKRTVNGLTNYSFDFIKSDNFKANIILADDELNPPAVLLMEAEPAI